MSDPANLIFGKYELIRRLALGGMGEVFLARQTGGVSGTERLVILKSLLPELAEQEGFVDQFLDEARVAAKLNHPNIVQMFEAGLWNGMYFIAMEYIRGDNLSRLQKLARAREVPLPVHIVVRMARDALLGLGHAHTAVDEMTGKPLHVVHRDVSPQNIMVRMDGVTKLVDFGIAKAANKLDRTKTGVLKGKLQFMSPEQVMGEDVDARTDQFAMGVVLWELLTGKRLFQGDNEIQILRAVSQQPILSPSSVAPGLPADLEAVVMRMLERDKHKRFDTCGEAADELTAWLNQGSRRVSENDVSTFVKQILGDSVDEATKNLTSGENFMLNLNLTPSRSSTGSGGALSLETSPTSVRRLEARQNRKSAGVAIGGGVAAAVILAGVMFALVGGDDPAPPALLPTTTTTTAVNGQLLPAPTATPLVVPKAAARREGGQLQITLNDPPGATILVDGTAHGDKTPTTLLLPIGPHTIEIVDASGRKATVPLDFPKPIVTVTTDPPGASITAGPTSFGITPAKLDGKLEGGLSHRLTLSLRGHVTREVIVEDLKDGDVRDVTVVLAKASARPPSTRPGPPPPSPAPSTATAGVARLTVNIKPSAKVYLDGDLVGTTPLVMPKVPTGKHTLLLERTDGTMKKTVSVTLKDGEDKKLPLSWD